MQKERTRKVRVSDWRDPKRTDTLPITNSREGCILHLEQSSLSSIPIQLHLERRFAREMLTSLWFQSCMWALF